MKKVCTLALIVISTLCITKAQAQKEGKQFSFGFALEGGPVIGDKGFKEVFGSEAGLSLRFSYKVGPGYITFSPGGALVLPKSVSEDDEEVKVGTHIPIKLGYKFIIGKFFVMAEGGYSFYTFYTADENSTGLDDVAKERRGGFTYAPSIGANLGKFEIGVRYQATMLKVDEETVKPSTVALRIGFNF
ncbi:MAG: hypothetical protein QM802_26255 [Agriterribacter sp.]